MVRQTQQLVMGNPLVCAMKCHPDKGALGIKKLENFHSQQNKQNDRLLGQLYRGGKMLQKSEEF